MLNPSAPIQKKPPQSAANVDTSSLLTKQMKIAGILQDTVLLGKDSLGTRDLKDLATASSTMIGLAQKTDHLLREVETLRLFSVVVMDFLRRRSDTLGEDLLAELRLVAEDLHAEASVAEAERRLAD
jgi:hypothetical protein